MKYVKKCHVLCIILSLLFINVLSLCANANGIGVTVTPTAPGFTMSTEPTGP